MDVAQILRDLWRRRLWVLLGVVFAILAALSIGWHVSLNPPSVRSKNLAIHSAEASVLIDAQQSVLADIEAPTSTLTGLATVYARYMTTFPVRKAIADQAGIPVEALVTEAPLPATLPSVAREPVAAQRSQKLLGEKKDYTLDFRADPGFPIINIIAQGPTVPDALRLANAGALGFQNYIGQFEADRKTPLGRRIVIRRLGLATGGTVGKRAKVTGAVAGFIGVMIAWCLLVLLAGNVAANWGRLDSAEAP